MSSRPPGMRNNSTQNTPTPSKASTALRAITVAWVSHRGRHIGRNSGLTKNPFFMHIFYDWIGLRTAPSMFLAPPESRAHARTATRLPESSVNPGRRLPSQTPASTDGAILCARRIFHWPLPSYPAVAVLHTRRMFGGMVCRLSSCRRRDRVKRPEQATHASSQERFSARFDPESHEALGSRAGQARRVPTARRGRRAHFPIHT
jgi:hypothetical protein